VRSLIFASIKATEGFLRPVNIFRADGRLTGDPVTDGLVGVTVATIGWVYELVCREDWYPDEGCRFR